MAYKGAVTNDFVMNFTFALLVCDDSKFLIRKRMRIINNYQDKPTARKSPGRVPEEFYINIVIYEYSDIVCARKCVGAFSIPEQMA